MEASVVSVVSRDVVTELVVIGFTAGYRSRRHVWSGKRLDPWGAGD
jgi:hypothetical protein